MWELEQESLGRGRKYLERQLELVGILGGDVET